MTKHLFLAFAIFCFVGNSCTTKSRKLEVEAFEVEGGWGYRIIFDSKTIIYQPIIPVIQSQQPFYSERDARMVGYMVKNKLIHKQMPPTVTLNELASAKIKINP